MKRLILIISILLLVGGAANSLAGAPPEPEATPAVPSTTTPTTPATTTPTDSTGQPLKVIPWKPPRVLKPGDLVRLGSTPEVCGVLQYPTYKTALSVQPARQPIIGTYCWATTATGIPVPNGRIYFYSAWRESTRARESTSAGTAQWQKEKIVDLSYPPPLGRWPIFTGYPESTQAQKQGRVTAVIEEGYSFKVKGTTVSCDWAYMSTGQAQVDCSSRERASYHLAFFAEKGRCQLCGLISGVITNKITGEEDWFYD